MPDLDEAKNQAMDSDQANGQADDQAGGDQSMQDEQDKQPGKMDQAKKKMDVTGDGKVNAEDAKKMGGDAVNKVKGLFKKS
jgi:hypothetical protein